MKEELKRDLQVMGALLLISAGLLCYAFYHIGNIH